MNRVRLPQWLCLALLLGLLPALAARAAGAPESLQARGNLDLAAGREVADVVVADGNLRLAGQVRGAVFVANGDVLLDPGALVQGSLTVFGGKAWVSAGARIGGDLIVFAGQAHLEEGAVIVGATQIKEKDPALTPEKIALVSRYLLLPRIVPNQAFPLDQLGRLDLSNLRLRRTVDQKVAYLDLGRAAKLPLDFKEVEDARELRAEGWGRVRITVVKFTGPAAAKRFWDALRETIENPPAPAAPARPREGEHAHPGERRPAFARPEEINHSVHSSLGDGAHWYFRDDGSSYLLWTKAPYLVAIQSSWFHDAPDLGREEWKRVEEVRDQVRLSLESLFQPTREP